MRSFLQRIGHTVKVGLLLPAALCGNAMAEAPQFSGEIATGVWSSTRMLDDRRGIAAARAKLGIDWQAAEGLRLHADAWALTAPERMDQRREDAGLRELYVKADGLPCAPAVGKRLVLWGRADGINPTDQIAASNYRRLTPKDADQRAGSWGLHLDCPMGAGRLQAHLLDRFEFHDVPLNETPGVSFREDRPRVRPTVALKYDVLGSAADWSVSFIDGHDLFPTLAVRSLTAQGLSLGREATPMRLLGADVAVVQGELAYRGEVAWVDFNQTANPFVARRRPYVSAVGGVEWSIGDRETISVQGFWKRLRDVSVPQGNPMQADIQAAQGLISNELDRTQYGVTLRYARPLFDSRADLDLFAVWAQPRGDWMLRGRLNYALSDAARLSVGFDLFRGPRQSFLGNLRANSLLFAEVGYSW